MQPKTTNDGLWVSVSHLVRPCNVSALFYIDHEDFKFQRRLDDVLPSLAPPLIIPLSKNTCVSG